MKLTVENLGAIKKGEILFNKNLILLTGPNNTGKSYLTYLIHAIFNFKSLVPSRFSTFKNINKFLEKSKLLKDSFSNNKTIYIKEFIEYHKADISRIQSEVIEANLIKIFASNKITPSVEIQIINVEVKAERDEDVIGFKVIDDEVYSIIKDGTTSSSPFPSKPSKTNEKKNALGELEIYLGIALTVAVNGESTYEKSYVFPSERTAINLFARDIVAKKAGSRDDIAVRVLAGEDIAEIAKSISEEQNTNPKYPLAINDYLNFVNGFEGSTVITKFNFIAELLESSIMGGKISISDFKQVVFQPHGTEHSLNLHESSSLVKSLSFLVIYLRHFASEGDWIIIDEPEINLHPNRQVAIARVFANMINAGLKLILSTHSDYLVKQLNNLVLLHDLNKSKKHKKFVEEKGYNANDLIDKKQVGAYFLNDGKVTPIDIEKNGIEVPSINDSINEVDDLAEEIFMKNSL